MEARARRFNIVIRNHVQLVGFRGIVESIARDFGLKGYVYNDRDGSVKIVCEGVIAAVENFVSNIRKAGGSLGVKIEKEEISDKAYLPDDFGRLVVADELNLRLDRGIELLEGIKSNASNLGSQLESIKKDTSLLGSIKTDTSLLESIKKDTTLLGSIKTDTSQLAPISKTLDEMKNILHRIAEK